MPPTGPPGVRWARSLRTGAAMPRPDSRGRLGQLGEALACRALVRRGYAILATRYRTRSGELDIVAEHRGTLVFVEVKTRRSRRFGTAGEAVTRAKRRRLARMAEEFLTRSGLGGRPCRFDVVTVDWGPPGVVEIYPGAFGLGE